MADQQAVTAGAFLASLGVNLHLHFGGANSNSTNAESAIDYLGIANLRDSPASPVDLTTWQQVAQAIGGKFDAFIGQTPPDGMQTELNYIEQLAQQGILNFIEGGDEEDDVFPASLGNNLQITALFQQTLNEAALSMGLPSINMSFGAGWTAANNWIGDYASVGDLSATAGYANAHTYPQGAPGVTFQQLNSDAHLAAASRPVIKPPAAAAQCR